MRFYQIHDILRTFQNRPYGKVHSSVNLSRIGLKFFSLADRLDRLESQENQKNLEISKLKIDIETAKKQTANTSNTSNISSNWVQVIKQGAKMQRNQPLSWQWRMQLSAR